MRTKYAITLLTLAILGLTACDKDLYDPNQSKETTVTDLTIPADFDWKLLKAGSCNITAAQSVNAAIYSDDSFSKESLLAIVPIKAGSNLTLPLSLAKGTETVYIQYQDAANVQGWLTAPVSTDGKINITIPGTATRTSSNDDFINGKTIQLYYPNGDFGTFLFEDNYPQLGDYDLNDFVMQYQFLIETSQETPNKIEHITFIMEVKAIGADQNIQYYIPHLRLPIAPATVVDLTVSERGSSANTPMKVVDVTSQTFKKNYLTLKFDGAEKNADKNPGSVYLNTESGFVSPVRTFIIDITFKETANGEYADLNYIDADGFDLFLANGDGTKEIHLSEFGSAFSNKVNEYKDENNFVWGLNVPAPIAHAIEKANFLNAYPQFADWVTEKATFSLWYKNGISKYLFDY